MVIITRRNFLKSIGGAIVTSSLVGLPVRAQNLPSLSISLPASNDSVPFAYAVDQGLFNDFGLDLQLRGFNSLRERDGALFLESVDGAMSDLTSVLCLIENNTQLEITSTGYENVDGALRFAIVTNFFTGIESLSQVYGRVPSNDRQKIGLALHTDYEYELDRVTAARGFTVDPDTYYSDNGDSIQLSTLVAAGSQDLAVVAEPIASYIEFITDAQQVPTSVIDDFSGQQLSPSIVAFQSSVIQQSPNLIEDFYTGYNAVINEFATTPREQIVEPALEAALEFFFPGLTTADLPPGAEQFLLDYQIPEFPAPRVFLQSEFDPISNWAAERNYISDPIPFGTVYNDQFISE